MAFFIRLDPSGIPLSHYGEYQGKNIGTQISPLYVAENGLRAWNTHLKATDEQDVLLSCRWNRLLKNPENDPLDKASANDVVASCADWLEHNAVSRGDFLTWEYPYQMSFATPPGWISGHTQVVGLQLLERAGRMKHIDPLLTALQVSVNDGGIAEHIDAGAIWFEKFAHPQNERPKILNGHLFAVIGLFDLADRLDRSDVRQLAEKGLEAARLLMPQFDLDGWSGYSIHRKPASQHYHDVVVRQLDLLSSRADWVSEWYKKFKGYRLPESKIAPKAKPELSQTSGPMNLSRRRSGRVRRYVSSFLGTFRRT